MTLFINSYSFIALGLLILMIVAWLVVRLFNPKWVALAVAVTFILMGVVYSVGSTKYNTVSNPEEFKNALTAGKPVLLELYSNF